MNKCRYKPDCKTCTKHNPQRQVLVETYKSHKEKQDTWHNAPQGAFGVIDYYVEIVWIIQIQPDKHDQPCQRHNCNKSRQRRQLTPNLCTENNDADTNQ